MSKKREAQIELAAAKEMVVEVYMGLNKIQYGEHSIGRLPRQLIAEQCRGSTVKFRFEKCGSRSHLIAINRVLLTEGTI